MALTLISNRAYTGPELTPGLRAYVERVTDDGGEIISVQALTGAFVTARALGIDATTAFSVTSAAWGIKRSGGNIVKMYSLFSPDGDLEVTEGTYAYVVSDGHPALRSVRGANQRIQSVGTTTAKHLSAIVAVKAGDNMVQNVISVHNAADPTTATARALQIQANTQTHLYNAFANGSSGTVQIEADILPWTGVGAIVTLSNQLKLFDAGSVLGTDATVTPHSWTDSVLVLARASDAYGTSLSGDIAEAWVLTEAAEEQALGISAYIHGAYAG